MSYGKAYFSIQRIYFLAIRKIIGESTVIKILLSKWLQCIYIGIAGNVIEGNLPTYTQHNIFLKRLCIIYVDLCFIFFTAIIIIGAIKKRILRHQYLATARPCIVVA